MGISLPQFPNRVTVGIFLPQFPNRVMELHLWPNMSEQEGEEHEIEEVVFEEEEPDTAAPSPLENVPISQWTSERTALQYCLTKVTRQT